MNANIGLDPKQRDGVIRILTGVLADQHVLYVKLRNYHWNITGPHFTELHALFEKQYDQLAAAIDETAERIRALGAPAPGSMAEFLQHARLKEHSGAAPDAPAMLANLLADHEAIVRQLRTDAAACDEQFADAGTNDFLVELLQGHEKAAWMLRACLARP